MSQIPKQLIIQIVLILLNAFFAATEMAMISLNPTKLRKMQEDGDKSAAGLLRLVEQPAGFLSTIQVGITLAGFLGSAFAADSFAKYLANWLYIDLQFKALSYETINGLSVVIITIVLSYFTLIFGELVPKRIAMQKPMQWAKVAGPVVAGLSVVMKPVVWFLSVSTNGVLRLLGLSTEAKEETVTEEEISMMVELGGAKGSIDEDEEEWIQNVFNFNDITVEDAMTRSPDVVSLKIDMPPQQIVQIIEDSGLSRYPVYEDSIHDILGIVHTREFLLNLNSEHPKELKDLIRPAYFVPETIHADSLFQDMQRAKIHLAVVINEYGETAGIITIEDLLEEIVGNIYDEFDPSEPPEIEKLEDNLWRVSGSTYTEDLADELDIDLQESDYYDTLGGMVLSRLRSIPEDGSTLTVTIDGLRIQVEKIESKKIQTALISKVIEPQPAEEQPKTED